MASKKVEPGEDALHKALTHPLRTKILLAIEGEGRLSPSRFVQQRQAAAERVSLNVASYHFRVLEGYEVIQRVEEVARRGATEHWYSLNPSSPVPDMLRVTQFLQAALSRGAGRSEIGGKQEALTVMPVEVDEQGREELDKALLKLKARLEEIGGDCQRRLRSVQDSKSMSLRVGFGALRPTRFAGLETDKGTAPSGS